VTPRRTDWLAVYAMVLAIIAALLVALIALTSYQWA
jgi:hypothetical protein